MDSPCPGAENPGNEQTLSHSVPPLSVSPLDLSVVIVTYRSQGEITACLSSLFEGGIAGLDAEVIVVDNASPDGTVDLVRQDFPQVRLMASKDNLGFSRGNNRGIEMATGRHILLLNPDTLVPPGGLRRCVDYLDAQPADVAAMTCRVESSDGSLQWECSRRLITPWSECCRALLLDRLFSRFDAFNREPLLRWDRRDERAVECLLGAFMLIRREALARIGGLDEQFFLMYEDVDWCRRAHDNGYRLLFWPEERITHLGGQSWRQEPIATFANSHISAMQYFRKHHPRSLGVVQGITRLGMAIKIGLLRLNLLRKPNDTYTLQRLAMARAASRALRGVAEGSGQPWTEPEVVSSLPGAGVVANG